MSFQLHASLKQPLQPFRLTSSGCGPEVQLAFPCVPAAMAFFAPEQLPPHLQSAAERAPELGGMLHEAVERYVAAQLCTAPGTSFCMLADGIVYHMAPIDRGNGRFALAGFRVEAAAGYDSSIYLTFVPAVRTFSWLNVKLPAAACRRMSEGAVLDLNCGLIRGTAGWASHVHVDLDTIDTRCVVLPSLQETRLVYVSERFPHVDFERQDVVEGPWEGPTCEQLAQQHLDKLRCSMPQTFQNTGLTDNGFTHWCVVSLPDGEGSDGSDAEVHNFLRPSTLLWRNTSLVTGFAEVPPDMRMRVRGAMQNASALLFEDSCCGTLLELIASAWVGDAPQDGGFVVASTIPTRRALADVTQQCDQSRKRFSGEKDTSAKRRRH